MWECDLVVCSILPVAVDLVQPFHGVHSVRSSLVAVFLHRGLPGICGSADLAATAGRLGGMHTGDLLLGSGVRDWSGPAGCVLCIQMFAHCFPTRPQSA